MSNLKHLVMERYTVLSASVGLFEIFSSFDDATDYANFCKNKLYINDITIKILH